MPGPNPQGQHQAEYADQEGSALPLHLAQNPGPRQRGEKDRGGAGIALSGPEGDRLDVAEGPGP